MGIVDFFREVRTEALIDEDVSVEEVEERFHSPINRRLDINMSGISTTTSGKYSESLVMSIPMAKACRDKICGAIKDLPVELYKRVGLNEVERVEDDNRLTLLNVRPNLTSTASVFKEKMVNDIILHGNSYTAIEWDGNKVSELWNLRPETVSPILYKDPKKSYITRNVQFGIVGVDDRLEFEEVMVATIDSEDGGVTGKGVIENGQRTIELALNELTTINAIMENGIAPSGVLEANTKLSDKVIQNLRDSLAKKHSGKNKGSMLILEDGMTYKKMSLTPTELGITETRTQTGSDICKLFGVPEQIVDSSSNTYGSVEAVNLFFLQYCVSTIIKVIEESYDQYLLTEKEKSHGYFFKINTDNILQSTRKERYDSLKTGLDSGILTINECRIKENLTPLDEDLDFFKFGLGNVFYYPETGRLFIPNIGIQFDAETGQVTSKADLSQGGTGGQPIIDEKQMVKEDETKDKKSLGKDVSENE